MLERMGETIVAVSSAPGRSAVGVVRLSGERAIEIVDQMATAGDGLSDRPGFTHVTGDVGIGDDLSLPATFYVFRAPHSYTRQDSVEIHSIGSPPCLELIRERAIELGALPAEPGEFTARAFLSGAMDLASAEAVAGVIRAQSDAQLRAARRMLDGALARRIAEVRDAIGELVALVEADIDFSEEPIDFITPLELKKKLGEISGDLSELISGAVSAERFEGLAHVLLLGRPNAGKSSLLNALSETSRAICAAVAGTTRDILSAPVRLGRGEAILLDAAGVDRSEDEIIARAREMTLRTAERVDLICMVIDLTRTRCEVDLRCLDELDVPGVVIAANKCDLPSAADRDSRVQMLRKKNRGPVCVVSATQGTGLKELREALAERLSLSPVSLGSESIVIGERQRAAIADARGAVGRAIILSDEASETIDRADLLAFEMRSALTALGSVTGEVTTEDLLSSVFANFCIGK